MQRDTVLLRPRPNEANTRVEEAFAAAGINVGGKSIPERRFRVECAACKTTTSLADIEPSESGSQTNYECPKCNATVVTVSPAPGLGGYRLGDWVVFPIGGMMIDVPGGGEPL